MGFLDRVKSAVSSRTAPGRASDSPPDPRVRTLPDPGEEPLSELPLTPESRRLGEEEKARIAKGLEELTEAGVDVDDLSSIGAGLDREVDLLLARQGEDPDAVVTRYAVAVGEHLHRRTDLSWEIVTDVFGTDLAVAAGDFVVVPGNLVAVRWMRREKGWVEKVVGHIVTVRTR